MAGICEPRRSESTTASGETSASSREQPLVVKLHDDDIVGKSSRSVVSTTTDATCVPTDVSECGSSVDYDDDHYDNGGSVMLLSLPVETIEPSDHEDEIEDRRQPPDSSPPVSIVDLLSDPIIEDLLSDPVIESSSTSVESCLGDDGIKKPPSLPSLLTSETKKKKDDEAAGEVDIRKGDNKSGDAIKEKAKAKGTVVVANEPRQRSVVVVPESEYNAKRRAMIRKKKRRTAPELAPDEENKTTVRELYVPPGETDRAVKKRKRRRKKKRERKTVAGAMGGMITGGVILGPLGVVLGAAVGGFCSRQAAKKAEKRDQRRREQQAFRDYASYKALQWHLNDRAAVFC